MRNVYDIKRDKNLNFILPMKYTFAETDLELDSVLIVIHLFYENSINEYLKYIEQIPLEIKILFTSSNFNVLNIVKEKMNAMGRTFKLIEKENRGRDISGLLVACRTEILKYQYVCFLHDKRYKHEKTQKDTELFVKCLWENMLGGSAYILNIIETFRQNPKLGVLLPPESVSDNFSFLFRNTWDKDFELMQQLAEKMKLNCDLNEEKKPLSLGTAFWARVDAQRKLFEIDWEYEDFNDEPLPGDGTISHAIERCFAYIAQDAGYETGIVMTDRFAGERMDYMQEILTDAFSLINKIFGIQTFKALKIQNQFIEELFAFASKYPYIYIYGAGKYGQRYAKLLKAFSYEVKAFVVTKEESKKRILDGIPIIPFSYLKIDKKNTGVVVAVSDKFKTEIRSEIFKRYPNAVQNFYFGLV